jgi:hypothetical protein
MKLLRVVSTFDDKKSLVGRQTNFLELDKLESGQRLEILPKGKNAKIITVEIVDSGDPDIQNDRVTKK